MGRVLTRGIRAWPWLTTDIASHTLTSVAWVSWVIKCLGIGILCLQIATAGALFTAALPYRVTTQSIRALTRATHHISSPAHTFVTGVNSIRERLPFLTLYPIHQTSSALRAALLLHWVTALHRGTGLVTAVDVPVPTQANFAVIGRFIKCESIAIALVKEAAVVALQTALTLCWVLTGQICAAGDGRARDRSILTYTLAAGL